MQRLGAVTDVGARFVRACEEVVPALAEHADQHDRDGTFPVEGLDALKAAGINVAVVPEAQGGWGLTSLHDLTVGLSRLAEGDASLAIAINMHLAAVWTMGSVAANERAKGREPVGAELLLGLMGGGSLALVNATEPGTDNRHPYTEVVLDGDEAVVTGTKIFSTLSPVADVFMVTARARFEAGGPDAWQTGFAVLFRDTPGVEIHDDWDALGMRGSGSGSIHYEGCRVPAMQWLAGGPWGEWTPSGLIGLLAGNIGLVGCFLGIAEKAHDLALEKAQRVARKAKGTEHREEPGVRRAVAEMEVALASARALLSRCALDVDELVDGRILAEIPLDEVHRVHAHFQATKLLVQRNAIEVVDTAMTVAGGSSYLAGSPFARLYRDVRAGPFMQPYSPIEAWDYIGGVALGTEGTDPR
jgi:alkylation response protein AidB-like acyl-CoA dehydrogenase